MARRSKKEKDKVRSLIARARRREGAASRLGAGFRKGRGEEVLLA